MLQVWNTDNAGGGELSDTSTELSTVIPRSDYHDNAAEMITPTVTAYRQSRRLRRCPKF